MEGELEQSERKYRSVVNNSLEGIFVVQDEGLAWANPAIEDISGYKWEDIEQMKFLDLVSPEDRLMVLENYKKRLKGIDIPSYDFRIINKNNQPHWVHLNATAIKWDGKEAILCFISDVHERRKAEEDLIIAKEQAEESDRLKSAFLANMSHEIRTPMNGILGFANLLQESDLSEKDQKEYIQNINKSGERMLNTINDLIDISRIEAGQMEVKISEINLNRQMDELYSFFRKTAEQRGLSLSYSKSLPDDSARFYTDPEKLYKTMVNLINNALKYTAEGRVEFGYTLSKQQELEFYVKDTGIGIPANRHKTIFDRFAQADLSITKPYEGSGLGLSITKAYIEMLGGDIHLESEPGKGSVFTFRIPYRKAKRKQNDNMKNKDQQSSQNLLKDLKILIVEDEITSDMYLTAIFKQSCRELLHATNGKEALQLITEQPDIDLILMDLKMPAMDGYEATRKIRDINKEVKIIAQTAYALAGDRQKALKAGCDEYVSKPVTKSLLIKTIEKIFVKP